jgi:ribonucleoside-diphosphate reductase alpha chain
MKLSENAIMTLNRRYLNKNAQGNIIETPEDMIRRVAKYVSQGDLPYGATEDDIKKLEEEFYMAMDALEFVPSSPTLMNAGNPLNQLFACFLLPVEDDMASIGEAIKNMMIIHKSGGGTGFSFSRLRPAGDMVKSTSGVSSGPISFMRAFDAATETVKQGGRRRGANMGCLRVDHPDILNFIVCKDKEGSIANFNISVGITDVFMDAVVKNGNYNLINPRNGNVVKSISAKEVFDVIVDHAWKNGEPGILFIDTINKHNPLLSIGRIEGTNPCVTGDTEIMTDRGYECISDLAGNTVNVWNGEEWSKVTPQVTGKNQKILRVTFSDGDHVDCTPYHAFHIDEGTDSRRPKVKKIEAKDLKKGMKLEAFSYPVVEGKKKLRSKESYTRGVFAGDGYISSENGRSDRNMISLYGEKKKLLPHLMYKSYGNEDGYKIYLTLDNSEGKWNKVFVPGPEYTIETRLEWFAGLLDTDGGPCGSGGYSIWSVDREFLVSVKRMLHTLGIGATLALGKASCVKQMPDGKQGKKEYECKDAWRLTVSGSDMTKLVELGLKPHRVNVSYKPTRVAKRFITVTSVEKRSNAETVYCFTEPKRHKGMFGSVVIGQCGEIPLLPFESCVLGAINLSKLVTPQKQVNWERLRELSILGVHFLDNVIDMNKYPIPEIEKMTKSSRKMGLGVMGWADMLIQLGIQYDSEEALELSEKVMKFINDNAELESIDLAKVRGPFPNWSKSSFVNNKLPRRNATLTTVAPTGTTGVIADASGGIEPNFALIFTRENVLGGNVVMNEFNKYFEPYIVKHGLTIDDIALIRKEGSIQHISKFPDQVKRLFRTSHDISPSMHIRMQAAFQKYVENSISKTINMPEHSTREDVANAYIFAHKIGCKGLTVYRNNSRQMQVLNLEKKETVTLATPQPIRKKSRVRKGDTFDIVTGCGKMYVTINSQENVPYECLISFGEAGGCVTSQCEVLAKLTSLCLQFRIPIPRIIKRIKGIRCSKPGFGEGGIVLSCPDAVAKALEDYLSETSETTKIEGGVIDECPDCPECGGKLIRTGGCISCSSCGYSRCE